MAFELIFNPYPSRPTPQSLRTPSGSSRHMLRGQFSITTWLVFGAFIQGLTCLVLPYPNIALVAPGFLYLLFNFIRISLIASGILPDPLAEGVIPGRSVPVFPNAKTGQQDSPAGQSVTGFLIAARANSSLGIFSPGYKEIGDPFTAFLHKMNEDPTRHGYLGSSGWLNSNGDGGSPESMAFIYFENEEKIHEFAHGPAHTEAMEWYFRNGGNDFKHIGIIHEIFAAPKNGWEGVYVNSRPIGLGATTKEAEIDGKKVWVNPLVKGKGRLNYSKGRMGRPFGSDEWKAYDQVLGEDEK